MSAGCKEWLRRMAYVAYLGLGTIGASEGLLRVFVQSDPAFYVAFSNPAPGTEVKYPYGTIYYNTDGFADREFEPVKKRPRVGYIGDSVCFGVGAGDGYRVSEVIAESYPQYEHMNFTGGLGGGTAEVDELAPEYASRYELDAVVYVMNLNDIRPADQREDLAELGGNRLFRMVEWFRGRSYLYTYLRQILKRARSAGDTTPAYEMHPTTYAQISIDTATRTSEIGRRLNEAGVRFVVLIVPYEMQISQAAAEVYRKGGTTWEPGFIDGATQDLLTANLSSCIVVDGLEAFLGPQRDAARRAEYDVGEAFVYNLGERLDWNHPNRLGHRLLAECLARSGALDGLGQGTP